jgi:uncharacterized delta-60 repeat protein
MRMRHLGYLWAACVTAWLAAPAHAQDPNFGQDGFAFAGFSDLLHDFSTIDAMATNADNRIVVVGHARTSGVSFADTAIAVARFTASGDLDTTFGNSAGRVLIGFDGFDAAAGVAILSDGRILVAGVTGPSTSSGPRSIALARLTSAGQLDLTFGASGRVTVPIGDNGTVSAMRLLADGRILVAGSVVRANTGRDFLLVRLRSDGSRDTSFGASGTFPNLSASVTLDFGGQDQVSAIAIQSDGRIVAAGVTQVTTDSRFALARFTANGLVDSTFGANGRVTTNFVNSDHGGSTGDAAFGVAIQPDGRIVAVGRAETDTGLARTDVALARYHADGDLDTSFGSGGRVTLAFTPGDPQRANDAAFDLSIQPDGRILTAGHTGTPFNEVFAVARFTSAGALDTSFGTNGKSVTDRRGRIAFDIAAQSTVFDVRFVVGGQGGPIGSSTRFAVARFPGFTKNVLPNGGFDLSPTEATIREGERLTYDFDWTVPEPFNWHDLQSLELRILDGADPIFWLRFDEATATFTVLDPVTQHPSGDHPAGTPGWLESDEVSFDLADARVIGSGATGPHVTLRLPLSFGRRHGGRTLTVDVRSTTDAGEVDPFTEAGTVRVMPAGSQAK